MILKGSQRGGANNLALHLLRTDTNDHVEVHQIRGFVSGNLIDAMREAWAISRGTKCQQFLFSLSFSPPADKDCSVEAFERAIDEAEKRLGLVGQPRIVVFHELKGRRHAHCVWSRIRADNMRAINLPLFKRKLNQLGRDLYVEHGWQMPRGFVKSEERNPLNFSLVEWQQAKRLARDPAQIKAIFQMCWSRSDSRKAFEAALEARGYYLAQGDRRGYVAIDVKGEVYSLSRWCGVATRDLAGRLGDPAKLPTIEFEQLLYIELFVGKLLEGHRDGGDAARDGPWLNKPRSPRSLQRKSCSSCFGLNATVEADRRVIEKVTEPVDALRDALVGAATGIMRIVDLAALVQQHAGQRIVELVRGRLRDEGSFRLGRCLAGSRLRRGASRGSGGHGGLRWWLKGRGLSRYGPAHPRPVEQIVIASR